MLELKSKKCLQTKLGVKRDIEWGFEGGLKTMKMLESKYSKKDMQSYLIKKSKIDDQLNTSKKEILQGDIKSRYMFGEGVIDGMNDFEIETDKITNKLNKEIFDLNSTLPYKDYL